MDLIAFLPENPLGYNKTKVDSAYCSNKQSHGLKPCSSVVPISP